MKIWNRLRAIVLSFYSRELYSDVAANWKGIGILYLLLTLAICWLPTGARLFWRLQVFASGEGKELVQRLPSIFIENGVMRTDPPGPHVLSNPNPTPETSTANEPLVLVDDTVDKIPPEIDDVEAIILTRREFGMIRPSRGERRVFELTPAVDMEITPDRIESFIGSLKLWVPPIAYVFALAGSLLMRTIQSLVYGGIAQALARRLAISLDYNAAVRLSAVAMTPVIVIRTLLWLTPWEPAWYFRWPVAIAITLAYLQFGVNAVRSSQGESNP